MAGTLGNSYFPGSTIRYQVLSARLGKGSSWSLSTTKSANDVYLTHRESGDFIHASFHSSGESHYALKQQSKKTEYFLSSRDRIHVAPKLFHAHQIIIPHSELSLTYVEQKKDRDLIHIPLLEDFDATQINLYLSDEPFPLVRIENACHVATLELGGGGFAILVARPINLSSNVHETFSEVIAEAKRSLEGKGLRNQETRIVLMVSDGEKETTKVEVEVKIVLE